MNIKDLDHSLRIIAADYLRLKNQASLEKPALSKIKENAIKEWKTVLYAAGLSGLIEIAKTTPKHAEERKTITNKWGMTFAYIPPGNFWMGSPENEPGRKKDEGARHHVFISKGFYMQTTTVTQGQWIKVMGYNPSYFKECGGECPVEGVSWGDAQKFIDRLNKMESKKNYRLPTEAEWEYACRAGTTTAYSYGANAERLGQFAWYTKNSGRKTHPVGKLNPNAWGLYDMHGNVDVWCADWYGDYPAGPVTDPTGPYNGSNRVVRGGSWGSGARCCRSAYRFHWRPDERSLTFVGFRLVSSLP